MDVTEMIGTAGFLVLSAPLVVLYVIQLLHKFALVPLMIGIALDFAFALMAGLYIPAIPLVVAMGVAVFQYVEYLRTRKPEPVYDIPSWLHDSGAWQRQYEPLVKTPAGEIGRHRKQS